MAPKPTPPPSAPPVAPIPAGKPAFDWDALLPAEASATKTVAASTRVNVLEDTPAPLRQRAEESLALSCAAIDKAKAAGTKLENLTPSWRIQPVASTEQGEEFTKILRRYAKYRPLPEAPATLIPFQGFYPGPDGNPVGTGTPNGQVTVRIGAPSRFVRTEAGDLAPVPAGKESPADIIGVRYVFKPLENKTPNRLPGTAG